MRPLLAALPLLALPLVTGPAATSARAVATVPAPTHAGAWPLDPRPAVLRRFDPPTSTWGAGHRGVDLLGRPGQPVHSSLAGRVLFAGRIAGRGVVVVGHGALRTTYEPVGAAVTVGQEVARGATLGTLGVVGSHCFPRACLHWGLRRGEAYLDPLLLVGAGPVRLLPLRGAARPLGVDGVPAGLPGSAATGAWASSPPVGSPPRGGRAVQPDGGRVATTPVARSGSWSGAGVRQAVRLAQAL